ncbi:MAG: hypoxanthine phosphoribosyltransferase [Bacteroidales bacterium]|nr:hypoxanthine phosphoribosyltransferase [Bacteroidales bacterium]
MDNIELRGKSFKLYMPNEEILACIDGVAEKINRDYAGKQVMLLCVLNGAILFTAELMKRLNVECELASIKLTSYSGTQRMNEVHAATSLVGDVKGKNVIICEDIVDSGNSMEFLLGYLKDLGAADIKICTMLFKSQIFKKAFKVDYIGKSIPNVFILGFGLDYEEFGRNYKDIYIINEQ